MKEAPKFLEYDYDGNKLYHIYNMNIYDTK